MVTRDSPEVRVVVCMHLVEAVWRPVQASITCLLCRSSNDTFIYGLVRALQASPLGHRSCSDVW